MPNEKRGFAKREARVCDRGGVKGSDICSARHSGACRNPATLNFFCFIIFGGSPTMLLSSLALGSGLRRNDGHRRNAGRHTYPPLRLHCIAGFRSGSPSSGLPHRPPCLSDKGRPRGQGRPRGGASSPLQVHFDSLRLLWGWSVVSALGFYAAVCRGLTRSAIRGP